jgi:hypothetical protein
MCAEFNAFCSRKAKTVPQEMSSYEAHICGILKYHQTITMATPHDIRMMSKDKKTGRRILIHRKAFKYVHFRRFRKTAKSDYQLSHVCLTVRPDGTTPLHWTDFHGIWYIRIFRKSVNKIQVPLKPEKSEGHFTWRALHMKGTSHEGHFTWRELHMKGTSYEGNFTWRKLHIKGTSHEGNFTWRHFTLRRLHMKGTSHEGNFTWRALYMKTDSHFLSLSIHFFLE